MSIDDPKLEKGEGLKAKRSGLLSHVWHQHLSLAIFWIFISGVLLALLFLWSYKYFKEVNLVVLLAIIGVYIIGGLIFAVSFIIKRNSYGGFRFAPESIGLTRDLLDFKLTSKNYARSIEDLDSYVSVIGMFGEMGSGKSSLIRMIIEKLQQDSFLYSYISLTETNETKDFEKLFQERWFEGIKRQYPMKLSLTSHMPVMESILRETKNGFFADIIRFFNINTTGLFPTEAKSWDKFLDSNPKPRFCSRRVGGFFGNIPIFSQKKFIVVIDEIERAQISEVYRVIEIIERFKNEGRGGLPLQIVFVLCISPQDLQDVIEKHDSEKGVLIQKFILEDPKSIGLRFFIPAASISQMQHFIKTVFDNEIKSQNLKEFIEIEEGEIYSLYTPRTGFGGNFENETGDKGALQFALATFLTQTPRVFARTINAVAFFLSIFSRKDKDLGLPFRLADLIILEYIKIRFPYVIDFIKKTIGFVHSHSEYGFDAENTVSHFYRKGLQEEKISDISAWIKKETGVEVPESDRGEIENLFKWVAHRWLEFISQQEYINDSLKDKYWEARSTSDPEKMLDWLSFSKESSSRKSPYRFNREIFDRHTTKGDSVVKGLSSNELLSYSKFLSQSNVNNKKMLLETLREVIKRLQKVNNKKAKSFSDEITSDGLDTVYDDAVYRAIFLALSIMEQEHQSEDMPVSLELKEVWGLLKELLYNPEVPSHAKLSVLNSFGNSGRGSGSIHARLLSALKMLRAKGHDQDVKTAVKHVFSEVRKRYLDGRDDIYTREKNPFFVLYQTWSGDKSDEDGLGKMRDAAKRNLSNHSDFLEVYWKKFPFESGWANYDDVLNSRDWFVFGDEGNMNIYLPLVDLVKITKRSTNNKELLAKAEFWGRDEVLNDQRLLQKLEVKDDPETLKSVLIKSGLLEEDTKAGNE